MHSLIDLIRSPDPAIRNQSLEARCRGASVDALLASTLPGSFAFQQLETEGRLLEAEADGARLARAALA